MTAVKENVRANRIRLLADDRVPEPTAGSFLADEKVCHLLVVSGNCWIPWCGAFGGLYRGQPGLVHEPGGCPAGHPLCRDCYPAS